MAAPVSKTRRGENAWRGQYGKYGVGGRNRA
jgi:hypothetical protein